MTGASTRADAIEAVRRDAPGVPITDDAELVRRRSTDRSAMLGPIMASEVGGSLADAVAIPADEAELIALVAACVRHEVPVVPRGAGTSNFGQSIPLEGGIVIDTSRIRGVLRIDADHVRVRAGTLLPAIDEAARPIGRELRIHPSSKRMSTAAGFVVGGHGGVGSMRHGGLADLGNVQGLRVITVEEEPRALELRGRDTGLVQFSFGMAGIVTEVEFPLTVSHAWRDVIVSFPTLADAMHFGDDLTRADGLDVKNCMPMEPGMASYLTPLQAHLPTGRAAALCMVAPASVEGLTDLAAERGGHVTMDVAMGDGPRSFPGYEYTWGHAMWWLRKGQPELAEVLFLLPERDPVGTLDELLSRVGGECWVSSTCQRFAGRPAPQVALGVDGSVPGRVVEVSAAAEALDCLVVNIHQAKLGSASIRDFGPQQRAFKAAVDPRGLCNPGHLADDLVDDRDTDGSESARLVASGWSSRWSTSGEQPAR
ncbi:MAG: FAD-linked oxidase [Actinomycetia bacterium]|nr:FAD-linked oxidase [Actinomycetes bacterium]